MRLVSLFAIVFGTIGSLDARKHVGSSSNEPTTLERMSHFVPLVAFQCGFRNQYLLESGEWQSDDNRYATCQTGKLDILKYCKKVYPKLNVTNIVEYSHMSTIDRWCKEEGTPCKWTHTVRPYHCIDGEFRSEALQVPHYCKFSHARDQCNDFAHFKARAEKECSAKVDQNEKRMSVRSFAVLEPCGLDLFTGVEFVCCPADELRERQVQTPSNTLSAKKNDDDEYDDDDDEDDDDDDSLATNSDDDEITEEVHQDAYFKLKNNPKNPAEEHTAFREAEDRINLKHRERIQKVMKEWSKLEARYQKMKANDAKGAEDFKESMNKRFQATVLSLEEEHRKNRQEVEAVHEERVEDTLNEKKRTATHDYRQALASTPQDVEKIKKNLKDYIRVEEKHRIHMLNRLRHLMRVDQTAAKLYKPTVVHRLRYIDLRINGTIAMLRDFPSVEQRVKPVVVAYWDDFRRENSPEIDDPEIKALNSLDVNAKRKTLEDLFKETYDAMHQNIKLDVKAPATTESSVPVKETKEKAAASTSSSHSEEDDDEYYEDEEDEETKKTIVSKEKIKLVDIKPKDIEPVKVLNVEKPLLLEDNDDSDSDSEEDDSNIKELSVDIEPIIDEKPALYRSEKFVHHQPVLEESSAITSSQTSLLMVAMVFIAFALLAVAIRRRRRHQGFIEVDVYTPEERHIAGMQVNGYENPTYSFFDNKA